MNSGLWLIRHGPTHAGTLTGWGDIPADLGDTAALARLAAALPDVPVISSDLIRASATADAITGSRPRLPHAPCLREMNFGLWEGLTADRVAAQDPDLSRRFWTDPSTAAPPGGEGWQTLSSRVITGTKQLLAAHKRLIIVAHFGPILSLIQHATGESTAKVMGHTVAPLSLTEIAVSERGWQLQRLNVTP